MKMVLSACVNAMYRGINSVAWIFTTKFINDSKHVLTWKDNP